MSKIVKQASTWCHEISGLSNNPSFTKAFATISTTNTTTFSGLAGTANDEYVGKFVLCVKATNLENEGQRREIIAFNASTDICTCDAFPAAISSGDQFWLMSDGLAKFVESTGGSAIDVIDTDRVEADDFFNNCYLDTIAADNNASQYAISDFDNATSKVSVALTGNGAVGDLYHTVVYDEGSAEADISQSVVMKEGMIGTLGDLGKFEAYTREIKAKLTNIPIRSSGTAANASTAAIRSAIGWILRSGLYERLGTGSAIEASSTTTSVRITDGDYTKWNIGDLVCINGEVAEITAVTNDTGYDVLTISPALSAAPAATDICYNGAQYLPLLGDVFKGMGIRIFNGDFEAIVGYGIVYNPTIKFGATTPLLLDAEGTGLGFYEKPITRVNRSMMPSICPISAKNPRVYLGSTALSIEGEITFNPKLTYAIRAGNGVDGFDQVLTKCEPELSFKMIWTAAQYALHFAEFSKKTYNILVQSRGIVGNPGIFGIFVRNCQLYTKITEQDGIYVIEATAKSTNVLTRGESSPVFTMTVF